MESENETVAEIVKEMSSSHEGMIAFEFMGYADRIDAAHKREVDARLRNVTISSDNSKVIAELCESLRLSTNMMEMVVQWLGKYPAWQEELRNCIARNRKTLNEQNA